MKGVSIRIPIQDENGRPTWPAKFPAQADIDEEKSKLDEISWQREMMLRIVPEYGQLITYSDVHEYSVLPTRDAEHGYICTWAGVDFASTKTARSDYTAATTVQIYIINGQLKIYILPEPLNRRMIFGEITTALRQMLKNSKETGLSKMFLESNGFQNNFYHFMIGSGYEQVVPITVSGDKRARLEPIASLIKDGTILFPKIGCRDLINQLVGFGAEAHDDLPDSLSLVVQQAINEFLESGSLRNYLDWVETNGSPYLDVGDKQPSKRFQSLIPDREE
jgi:predicted phage terminase large subunit-like protein